MDGAIHRAGGPAILAECRKIVSKIGSLPAGQGCHHHRRKSRGKICDPHRWPGLSRREITERPRMLASCHRECIRLADEHCA